ncbi:hypothetical protein HELRODRAFT_190700 [Helobdella robusta]|uniref:Uncharacterized protein n=1 Tax=Helobdella robusta TaxID=6412 RepID=T1FS77_HELRO|nr:hypothetical protein HELRODRAFT_190700 [Helobdella robusta]ESO09050.1 hypothetical protein HELRODRAFT_190700 [Helobdella robusta]
MDQSVEMSQAQYPVLKQPEPMPSSAPPYDHSYDQPASVYPNYTYPALSQPVAMPGGAGPTAPNVVIVNQQTPYVVPPTGQPQNIRDWSTGMCSCCEDVTGCLYCTFCFPCFSCTLARKMNECCLGPLCCPGFLVAMRSKMRGQHGIRGSIFDDVCGMTFCTPCMAHQMYRELDKCSFTIFKGKIIETKLSILCNRPSSEN